MALGARYAPAGGPDAGDAGRTRKGLGDSTLEVGGQDEGAQGKEAKGGEAGSEQWGPGRRTDGTLGGAAAGAER